MESNQISTLSGPAQIVLNYISQGVSQEMAAQAAGVTPGYVSQLMRDEAFLEILARKRSEASVKTLERSQRYDSLEDKILKKLDTSLAFCMDPVKLAGILQRVVAAKGRDTGLPVGPTERGEVVSITLPTAAALNFTVNINNQVIQAGAQTLVPIQSALIADLASKQVSNPFGDQPNVKLLDERTSGNP